MKIYGVMYDLYLSDCYLDEDYPDNIIQLCDSLEKAKEIINDDIFLNDFSEKNHWFISYSDYKKTHGDENSGWYYEDGNGANLKTYIKIFTVI